MTSTIPEDFDGFIMPDGEIVSIKDVDRMFSITVKNSESVEKIIERLQSLAGECADSGYYEAAEAYNNKILSLADTPDEKARCLLEFGQLMERSRNYPAALEAYSLADSYRSLFADVELPFVTVEYDSRMILDSETALGELSPLLAAYGDDVFEAPSEGRLFELMVSMISEPWTRVSRKQPKVEEVGERHFWFAPDVTAAKAEMTSIVFTMWNRFAELGHRLQTQVQEQCKNPTAQPGLVEVVYSQWGDCLVFIKRSEADHLCVCHNALETAKTWGEFRSLVGQDTYDEIIQFMGLDNEGTIMDFAAFYEERIHHKPDTTPEQAREEYLKLPVGDRFPEDDDPFSSGEVPGVDDCDWPDLPKRRMWIGCPKRYKRSTGGSIRVWSAEIT